MSIQFHLLTKELELKNKNRIKKWLKQVAKIHIKKIEHINIVICPDDYLLDLNKKHLNHDFYTDIITFDLSIDKKLISGDLFISYDRVVENALNLSIPPKKELRRVIVHGLLHLLGYDDKTKELKLKMTEAENESLTLWKSI